MENQANATLATAFSAVPRIQRIKYKCGCEVTGPPPLPQSCPTHGDADAQKVAAGMMGRLGGQKRMERLSPEDRRKLGQKAAEARWRGKR